MKTTLLFLLITLIIRNNAGLDPSHARPFRDAQKAVISSLADSTRQLRQIYTRELGVREASNHNDGSRVEEYLHCVGLKKGSPWCAAYVCFCLGKAGIPNPRSGYCPNLFPAGKVIWERKFKVEGSKLKVESQQTAAPNPQPAALTTTSPATRNSQLTTQYPSPGDVFGIWFPDKGRIAHVGFIDNWGEKYAVTVEGNTNEAGSRDGDGVYRKRRLISSLYKISRYR